VVKVTRYRDGDDVRECLLCGHVDKVENGGRDYNSDDWYCDTCLDTAPSGEVPKHVW